MKKKIKSAVISIVVIAVLLLAILIGVKNGTLDKLTKEMPTLETKQEETKKSAENESQKNESSNSVRIRNSSRRDIANVGQQFELRNNDVKYTYDENNRETYNVFYITVKSVNISRQCDFDINRIDFGLSTKRDSMDNNDNFISDYYYMTVELEVTKDINDNEMFADDYNNLQTLWTSVKVNKDGTYNKIKDYETTDYRKYQQACGNPGTGYRNTYADRQRYHAYRYDCNAPAHRRNRRISFQSSSTDCQDSIYLFHCRTPVFLTNKTYRYENKYMYIFRSCHAGCMATERTYQTGQKTSTQYS